GDPAEGDGGGETQEDRDGAQSDVLQRELQHELEVVPQPVHHPSPASPVVERRRDPVSTGSTTGASTPTGRPVPSRTTSPPSVARSPIVSRRLPRSAPTNAATKSSAG